MILKLPGCAAALLTVCVILPLTAAAGPGTPAADLYRAHCASCHNANRLGAMGPALLPQNLHRLRKSSAAVVIKFGRPSTQMPGFADRLSDRDIAALVEYIYSPPARTPVWGLREIRASHIQQVAPGSLGDKPVFSADPQNLFIVVELGDHHATVLDGDRFEPIARFATRFAVHGGPKFSRDGRYVYFASRDGWISKYDIYNLQTVAEVRAGINTRNAAVSFNDRYVAVGNYLPHNLVILDAETLEPVKVIPTADDKGHSSRVSAVYTAPPRDSFIVALKDIPEIWEIKYDAASARAGFIPRRIKLADYLDDFFFDPDYRQVIGASRPVVAKGQRPRVQGGQVVDLDSGRQIAKLDLPGLPHLGSGITWIHQGRRVLATPNLSTGVVSIIDMQTWKTIKRIKTLGPGFFMRSHHRSRYAFVDVFFGPNRDKVHVIDKQSLKIVKTLDPAPGKTSGHVEFTKDGRYALLSIWDNDGALVVYDTATLKEVKRLPMRKPSGKYNVYNKTHYEAGTSH